ncbi:MAG: hypothetical protein VR76_08455 [Pseudomonas sp. BRH_c35]|nr:MAG: hypothetical protein VR76_08455 [Pseudomonas sp. BRH_c35]
MKSQQHADAFARSLTRVLLQLRESAEAGEREAANLAYATAMGLIAGATLCGGLSKEKGQALQATLDETRSTLMNAFGAAPVAPVDFRIN